MPYDWGVEGVLAAFGRRPVAGVGLLVAAVWIAVVAVECSTAYPWDGGGWYAMLTLATYLVAKGVAGVVAFVWLVDRTAA